jgi:histidinol-phosphate aminotransferase
MSLGPLEARVPPALRGAAAYHVPQPANIRAKLDANELPYTLPSELRTRLAAVLAEIPLERYPDPQARELRAVVANQLGVAGDQLTFGNGSDELIAMLVNAFATGPVLYPTPTFVYYKLAAVARGLETLEIPLDARFDLDEIAVEHAIIEQRPAIVFLALPNNPTGTLWRMDFACDLAARHRDTVIVSDEAYCAYAGKSNLPHLAAHPNLVIMRTLSKVGLAGLRVGYTIAAPAIAQLLEKVRPPYNLSALDQRAAVFALREARDWCDARAAEVVTERARLAAGLAKHGEVFASEANLVLVRFPNARAVWQRLVDAGVLVRIFDAGPLAGCLRVTVGTPAENDLLLGAL